MSIFHSFANRIENTESPIVFAALFPVWVTTVWLEFQVEKLQNAVSRY